MQMIRSFLQGIGLLAVLFCAACFSSSESSRMDKSKEISQSRIDAWNYYLETLEREDDLQDRTKKMITPLLVDFSLCPFLSESDLQLIKSNQKIEPILFALQMGYEDMLIEKPKIIEVDFYDKELDGEVRFEISEEEKIAIVALFQKIMPDDKIFLAVKKSPADKTDDQVKEHIEDEQVHFTVVAYSESFTNDFTVAVEVGRVLTSYQFIYRRNMYILRNRTIFLPFD